jgi:GNAT superfamily N-acetyltransferase
MAGRGESSKGRARRIFARQGAADLGAAGCGGGYPGAVCGCGLRGQRPARSGLRQHALTWIGAFEDGNLVGFVQVAWDGGEHAFIVDTAVEPGWQGRGIGAALVRVAVDEAANAGCEWVHVDFEPHLESFYRERCGFRPTAAGLIRTHASAHEPVGGDSEGDHR